MYDFEAGMKLRKKKMSKDKNLYLVETISIFRNRYVVEAKEAEHAADHVVVNTSGFYDEHNKGSYFDIDIKKEYLY